MRLPEFLQRRPLVYRIYDTDDRLIYIGHSCSLQQRFVDHSQSAWWWSLAARIAIQLHPDRNSVRAAEAVAIQEEQPMFNVACTGRDRMDFEHWTDNDRRVCGLWQLATWERPAYLPPVPLDLRPRNRKSRRSAA